MSVTALIVISTTLAFFSVGARATDADSFAGRATMNGFALKDFPDFEKNWKLVTVRYREDTKEMRFTYANDVAAKALGENKTDYPKGAVFAKIGLVGEADPAFKSSVVPTGAKRYQFMIRDKEKFAETDGWGYALFNAEGKTFVGNPKDNSLACAACHKLVPDRGYVFSQFASFSPFVEKTKKSGKTETAINRPLLFKSVPRESLEKGLRRFLPEKFKTVRSLQGDLQKHMFEGTVNEVGPFLATESAREKAPAVLVNGRGDLFAYAYADEKEGDCAKGEIKTVVGRTVGSNRAANSASDETIVRVVTTCTSTN